MADLSRLAEYNSKAPSFEDWFYNTVIRCAYLFRDRFTIHKVYGSTFESPNIVFSFYKRPEFPSSFRGYLVFKNKFENVLSVAQNDPAIVVPLQHLLVQYPIVSFYVEYSAAFFQFVFDLIYHKVEFYLISALGEHAKYVFNVPDPSFEIESVISVITEFVTPYV